MMSTISTIDYVSVFFPHKTVEKIHGQPNYRMITKLQQKIKVNASSVPSNLGGGLYGHLDLVLPTSKYNSISGCHFEKPYLPEMPKLNEAQNDAIRISIEYDEQTKLFYQETANTTKTATPLFLSYTKTPFHQHHFKSRQESTGSNYILTCSLLCTIQINFYRGNTA